MKLLYNTIQEYILYIGVYNILIYHDVYKYNIDARFVCRSEWFK